MAVILPFEEALYRQRLMNVDYVGHPLLDVCPREVDRKQVVLKLGVDQGHPVVGLLPGSRKEEIKNLLPVMVNAAEILRMRYPEIQCVLPLAPGIEPALVQFLIDNSEVSIKVFQGGIYKALSVCDVAMVSSGTATLETAVMGVPMVVVYKLSSISYWVGKMFIRVPYVGLVNLIGKEEVAPELIQGDMTAGRLAHEVQAILEDEEVRANMIKKLKGIKDSLGGVGASDRTARIALEMMR